MLCHHGYYSDHKFLCTSVFQSKAYMCVFVCACVCFCVCACVWMCVFVCVGMEGGAPTHKDDGNSAVSGDDVVL